MSASSTPSDSTTSRWCDLGAEGLGVVGDGRLEVTDGDGDVVDLGEEHAAILRHSDPPERTAERSPADDVRRRAAAGRPARGPTSPPSARGRRTARRPARRSGRRPRRASGRGANSMRRLPPACCATASCGFPSNRRITSRSGCSMHHRAIAAVSRADAAGGSFHHPRTTAPITLFPSTIQVRSVVADHACVIATTNGRACGRGRGSAQLAAGVALEQGDLVLADALALLGVRDALARPRAPGTARRACPRPGSCGPCCAASPTSSSVNTCDMTGWMRPWSMRRFMFHASW